MFYYIRKEWKNNLISIILTIICTALQIGTNLLAIQQLQSIIEWNLLLENWDIYAPISRLCNSL